MSAPSPDRYHQKRTFFDQFAKAWEDKDFTPDEQPKLRGLLDACELTPGSAVLEPGCGAGRLTRRLGAAVGPTGRVIAVDVSPEMAAACRRANPDPPVEVHAAAVEDLDLDADSLDRVVCFAVLPHIEDKALALARWAGWLKPDGVLVICHFMSRCEINAFHRHAHDAVAHDLLPAPDELASLLTRVGLVADRAEDEPGWFLMRARKVADP